MAFIINALIFGSSGPEPWPGTLSCVLVQDTLLLQCLSSSIPFGGGRGGVEILLDVSSYGNQS